MNRKPNISKQLLWIAAITVSVLLLLNFILTRNNNRIINENRLLQQQAEDIKIAVSHIAIDIIHNIDLSIRSFALFREEKYLYPWHIAGTNKDSVLAVVERKLHDQHYPLDELYQLKDSIEAYQELNTQLLAMIRAGETERFMTLANQDRGYRLWLQYESFARGVYRFEDKVSQEAVKKYRLAERSNFWTQVILILISLPTLFITANHSYQKFSMEVRLRKAEQEKAAVLETHNEVLERTVEERTHEIQEKNRLLQQHHEEIRAQNEEITAQNEELYRQRESLAVQNQALVESKRQQLGLYSKMLQEKSEVISQLTEQIETLKQMPSSEESQLRNFNKILHSTILTDEDWEKFKKTFDDVYPDFFATLRYKFPDITTAELRLAALMKMNLSLKEAASALGISAESVKKSRYRLKKKIALNGYHSLEEFIRAV